ncbi:MAG: bifunctional diaminohydroxyphosphoribosylaminopyrimidine deaminase/5-amino-6-(5-phosphoribosylamino)uracil reductase RibD [Acidobacteriota bacterium]
MVPDGRFMAEALEEAKKGRGRTHPNPAVGAVVVQDGVVVGRGWHRGPGTAHAEVEALREAGERARGALLYVTLEPCNTYGRTPPCTEAIRAAGLRGVVAAVADPNPRVSGRGASQLREAGIEVVMPFGEEAGRAVDPAYHLFYEKGRPMVHLKAAATLDGCVVPPPGTYFTGEEARRLVHEQRFESDALLVSAGTVLHDDPLLTVRLEDGRKKALLRVLLDGSGRLTGRERVFATAPGEGPILWIRGEEAARLPQAPGEGVEVAALPRQAGGGISLEALLGLLRDRSIMALYVEAVGRLAGALLAEGWVDCLSLHLAPRIQGGAERPRLAALPGGLGPLALPARSLEARVVGSDWVLAARLEGRCLPAS